MNVGGESGTYQIRFVRRATVGTVRWLFGHALGIVRAKAMTITMTFSTVVRRSWASLTAVAFAMADIEEEADSDDDGAESDEEWLCLMVNSG